MLMHIIRSWLAAKHQGPRGYNSETHCLDFFLTLKIFIKNVHGVHHHTHDALA